MLITIGLIFLFIICITLYHFFNKHSTGSSGEVLCAIIGIAAGIGIIYSSLAMAMSVILGYNGDIASFSNYQNEYNVIDTYFKQDNTKDNPYLYAKMVNRALIYNENVVSAQNFYDNPFTCQYSRAWAKDLNLIELPKSIY